MLGLDQVVRLSFDPVTKMHCINNQIPRSFEQRRSVALWDQLIFVLGLISLHCWQEAGFPPNSRNKSLFLSSGFSHTQKICLRLYPASPQCCRLIFFICLFIVLPVSPYIMSFNVITSSVFSNKSSRDSKKQTRGDFIRMMWNNFEMFMVWIKLIWKTNNRRTSDKVEAIINGLKLLSGLLAKLSE